MYYFRDGTLDQHLACGVTHAALARTHPLAWAARRKHSKPPRSQGSPIGILVPFLCIGVTFWVGLMVMDVLGLEHLVVAPSFDTVTPQLEQAAGVIARIVVELIDKIDLIVASFGI